MTRRERRAVIGGCALIGLVLVLRVGAASLGTIARHRDHLLSMAQTLARARAQLASVGDLEDSAAVIRRRLLALAPDVFPVGTSAETAATIAGEVNTIVDREHVRIVVTETLPDSSEKASLGTGGIVRTVGLSVTLESDLEGILGVITALESHQPALIVDRLELSVIDVTQEASRPLAMRAELFLTALALSGQKGGS